MTRTERAAEIAEALRDAGIAATSSVHELQNQLPAVLVAPPTIDWTEGTYSGPAVTWTLHVVASTVDPDRAWDQIDELLAELWATDLGLERAVPGALQLSGAADPLPSYTVTFTETLED